MFQQFSIGKRKRGNRFWSFSLDIVIFIIFTFCAGTGNVLRLGETRRSGRVECASTAIVSGRRSREHARVNVVHVECHLKTSSAEVPKKYRCLICRARKPLGRRLIAVFAALSARRADRDECVKQSEKGGRRGSPRV